MKVLLFIDAGEVTVYANRFPLRFTNVYGDEVTLSSEEELDAYLNDAEIDSGVTKILAVEVEPTSAFEERLGSQF